MCVSSYPTLYTLWGFKALTYNSSFFLLKISFPIPSSHSPQSHGKGNEEPALWGWLLMDLVLWFQRAVWTFCPALFWAAHLQRNPRRPAAFIITFGYTQGDPELSGGRVASLVFFVVQRLPHLDPGRHWSFKHSWMKWPWADLWPSGNDWTEIAHCSFADLYPCLHCQGRSFLPLHSFS